MTTAIAEKIEHNLDLLKVAVETTEQTMNLHEAVKPKTLVDRGVELIKTTIEMRHSLEEGLRQGQEREALLKILSKVRLQLERQAALYARFLASLNEDAEENACYIPIVTMQVQETTQFLDWLNGLLAKFSKPVPTVDISQLPPSRERVGISEARARLGAKKIP